MRVNKTVHLIFLAHVWACIPFLLVWSLVPGMAPEASRSTLNHSALFAACSVAYLAARTVLAFVDPPGLRWEFVFPPLDVIMISIGISAIGPDSVLMYAYLMPIAESLITLNFWWAGAVGAMSMLGAIGAIAGKQTSTSPLVMAFELVFLVIIASLLSLIARVAAALQADLRVATDRNRIALEMHDGVQAQLIAIASQLELIRCIAPSEGRRAAGLAADCRDLARRAADDLRFLVHRLRAPMPAEAFVPALQQYIHNLGSRCPLTVCLEVRGDARALPADVQHALFRIVQESLTNVQKHADAHHAQVLLEFGPHQVRCSITDDGKGLDPDAVTIDGDHVGLASIRERVARLSGTARITSRPSGGASIEVSIPAPPQREMRPIQGASP